MDALGVVFLILFLLILITSNIIFSKKLKKTGNKHNKHQFIFFILCLITISLIVIAYFIFESIILIDILKLEFTDTKTERIGKFSVILPVNIILNYFLLKYYLKKIKLINEIELIGTE